MSVRPASGARIYTEMFILINAISFISTFLDRRKNNISI